MVLGKRSRAGAPELPLEGVMGVGHMWAQQEGRMEKTTAGAKHHFSKATGVWSFGL